MAATAEGQQPARGALLEAAVLKPLQAGYDRLTRAEKKLASYVLARPSCLVLETASTMARNVGVSEMTVSRFLRKLGFEGLNGVRDREEAAGTTSTTEAPDDDADESSTTSSSVAPGAPVPTTAAPSGSPSTSTGPSSTTTTRPTTSSSTTSSSTTSSSTTTSTTAP